MNKLAWVHKNCKFASMRGEFWITNDGQVEFADGDIGDMNHEMHVIQHVQSTYCDDQFSVDGPDWESFCQNIYQEAIEQGQAQPTEPFNTVVYRLLKVRGMSDEEIHIANGNGDARGYAIETMGWKRVEGTNIETQNLTQQDIDAIRRGIEDILMDEGVEEGEEGDLSFSIHVYANNNWLDVPYSDLREGRVRMSTAPSWGQDPQHNPLGLQTAMNWVRRNCKFALVMMYPEGLPDQESDPSEHLPDNQLDSLVYQSWKALRADEEQVEIVPSYGSNNPNADPNGSYVHSIVTVSGRMYYPPKMNKFYGKNLINYIVSEGGDEIPGFNVRDFESKLDVHSIKTEPTDTKNWFNVEFKLQVTYPLS